MSAGYNYYAFVASIVLFVLITPNAPAEPVQNDRIDGRSVWVRPNHADFSQCNDVPDTAGCAINVMRRSGATPQALALAQRMDSTPDSDLVYAADFRALGPVDLVRFAEFGIESFPYYSGYYLVNGRPNLIEVQQQETTQDARLSTNLFYQRLKRQYPALQSWGGEDTEFVTRRRLGNGRSSFIFAQPFKLFHAGGIMGYAEYALDFNGAGDFLGTKLLGVTRRRP